MSITLKIGQRLEGKLGSYLVSTQVSKDIWSATNLNPQFNKVIVKTAPQARFENEREILKHFRTCVYIRQLLDETQDPPSLILQHLDDNLLQASTMKTLQSSELKFIGKRVLEAIQTLHEDGYTQTGMFMLFISNPDIVIDMYAYTFLTHKTLTTLII